MSFAEIVSKITYYSGFASLIVSIIAISVMVYLFILIQRTIKGYAVYYERNYEDKKKALVNAMNVVDEVYNTDAEIKDNAAFCVKANSAYNELMCVTSDGRIVSRFYAIAIDEDIDEVDDKMVDAFKDLCRNSMGHKGITKKAPTRKVQPAPTPQPIQRPAPTATQQTVSQRVAQRPIQRPLQRPVQNTENKGEQK